MILHLFHTDIKSKRKVRHIKSLLDKHTDILKWSIDIEDIDNVLKIESNANLTDQDIIQLIRTRGFFIEVLED